ncbi:hypothetical protein FACS1894139_14580 [Planctomycetales bacterium]|nr:hypothetical protein FACS1894107_12200 [Planctomycetales bacterium]GHT00033.1 hypothetical protein FACS1894108_11210 [Planctomycetales bacterium]GHT07110.1 hypothetical protein FACS1894139_14580 [Planctomycetales bacterium]
MGKELISASGKGHKAAAIWWLLTASSAAVCVVLALWLAQQRGDLFVLSNSMVVKKSVLITITAICSLACIVMGCLCQTRISGTYVAVYENGIEGSSVAPKFPLALMLYCSISSLQLREFRLTFDQVSSVDVVNENSLIIHATNTEHKIYAMNAREVRNVILAQKTQVNG